MTNTTYIPAIYSTVGETATPQINKTYSSEMWCSVSDFTYSGYSSSIVGVNASTGKITAKKSGHTTIDATHKVTGRMITFSVYIANLPIYQTPNTFFHDKDGNKAQDLLYNDMTINDLRDLPGINASDFNLTTEQHRERWGSMVTTLFSTGELETVILDMIDHFMNGGGAAYSNSTLTNAVVAHESTTSYTSSIETYVKELMNEYDGDISKLAYSVSTRGDNPLVKKLSDNNVFSPVYNTPSDTANGLRICLDSLWGNKVEVSEFTVSGSSYTCTLHYTLYDHFGLDAEDVVKFGYLAGFGSWYILQHYSAYNGDYVPYLTLIEFDVSFTGAI